MSPSTKRDALLFPALFIFNVFVFSAWVQLAQVATKPWLLLVWLYGLVGFIPLAWRDKAPGVVFATEWVLTTAAWFYIMPNYIPVAGITVALYAVAVHLPRRASLLALLVSCVPIGLALTSIYRANHLNHSAFEPLITNGVLLVITAGSAWGLGRVTHANQQHVQNLERERESAREAEVLATERRRIAQELHDIVSHAVTGIVFQAAGATRVSDTDFAQARQALANIETAGRQVMTELQRLVRVLEAGDSTSHPAGASQLKPQPRLADMSELLTSLEDAGLPVTVHIEGHPVDLDPSVDLTAYRIVQEGLVNVAKHAGKNSNPHLRLVWQARSLRIQIDNDTNVAAAHRGQALSVGRGLVGLHERTQAVGGRLDAGPHHGGGYRLTATLPLTTPEDSSVPGPSNQGRVDQGKMPT